MISLRDVVTGFGNRDPLAEVWRRNLRGGGGSAEITGVPPLRYIGDGRPLSDYLIAGNTVQDGTPSAEAPVDVTGSGVRTANGFKLPPTVNDTEYPIYLGTVPTTRRVKKLVLTGEEAWLLPFGTAGLWGLVIGGANSIRGEITHYCSHYEALSNAPGAMFYNRPENTSAFRAGEMQFIIVSREFQTSSAFKSYLAAQYANGTPVTVWYVLATPETGVVNEPLMKIGDYADTISFAQAGVTIPTVSGENVLDVPTTVPPSQITIKGGISSV